MVDRDISIKSPSGDFVNINAYVKKQGYVRTYTLEYVVSITCDEKHLVKQTNGDFIHIRSAGSVLVNNEEQSIVKQTSNPQRDRHTSFHAIFW
jgi:hypothetical protein